MFQFFSVTTVRARSLSRASHRRLHDLPCFPPVTHFPALATDCTFFWRLPSVSHFSRAYNRSTGGFPRLPLAYTFPRMPSATLSVFHACHRSYTFPRLPTVHRRFFARATSYTFSRPCSRLRVFPLLPLVTRSWFKLWSVYSVISSPMIGSFSFMTVLSSNDITSLFFQVYLLQYWLNKPSLKGSSCCRDPSGITWATQAASLTLAFRTVWSVRSIITETPAPHTAGLEMITMDTLRVTAVARGCVYLAGHHRTARKVGG